MKHFRLSSEEMSAIPYIEFENQYNPSTPGRSYNIRNVEQIAYRKAAMLVGVHDRDIKDAEIIKQGKVLYEAR